MERPDSVQVVRVRFDLAGDVAPREVRGFIVRWELEPPDRFVEHTAFRRRPVEVRSSWGSYEWSFPFYYRYSGPRYCW